MKYRLTPESRNKKTGRIPVATTSADSCPPSCPFRKNGCYADGGPLAIVWRQVDDIGTDLATFCDTVASFPAGQLWRHNQAGDLPGIGETIDTKALGAIVKANKGRRGFTYTHKNPFVKRNANAIAKANRDGFTINLSANNLDHADKLADLDIAPVVTVLPSDGASTTRYAARTTPKGRKVVQCPATYRDDVSCKTCQLCQRQRDVIVGFPAHGAAHRKASAVAA
jgi:hypothetical protein